MRGIMRALAVEGPVDVILLGLGLFNAFVFYDGNVKMMAFLIGSARAAIGL